MEINSLFKFTVWTVFIVMLFREIFAYLKGQSSKSWRRHSATIIDVKVDVKKQRIVDSDGALEQERHLSMPFVRYEYTYSRRKYKSKRVPLIDDWTADYGESSEAVVGVNPGSDITVYVNPKNPRQSVLSRGYKPHNLKELLVVFMIAFFSIFIG